MISFLQGCFQSAPAAKTATQMQTIATECPVTVAFQKVVKDDIDAVNERVYYLRCELGYRVRRVDFNHLVHSLHNAVETDKKLIACLVDQTFRVVAATTEMITKLAVKPKALLGKSISTLLSEKDTAKFKSEEFTPMITNVAFDGKQSKAFHATVYKLQYGSYYVAMLDVDKTSKNFFEQRQNKLESMIVPYLNAGAVEKESSFYYDSTEYEIAPKKGLAFQNVISHLASRSAELAESLVFVCTKQLEIVALNEKAQIGIGHLPARFMNTKLTDYMTFKSVMRLTSALRSERQNPGKVYKEFQACLLTKGNEELEVKFRWDVIGNDYFLISLRPHVSFSIELSTPQPTARAQKPEDLRIEIPGAIPDDEKRREGKEGIDSKDRDTSSSQVPPRILLSRSFEFPSVTVSALSLDSGTSSVNSRASSNTSSLASTPNLSPEKNKGNPFWSTPLPRLTDPHGVIVNESINTIDG